MPFLQRTIKEFSIIPALVGEGSPRTIAQNLVKYIDEDDLLIISTDLSHYLPYEKAVEIDKFTIESVIILDMKAFEEEKAEACGAKAVAVLIEIAKIMKWKPELIKYANSGDITGEKDKVVGYASIMFT